MNNMTKWDEWVEMLVNSLFEQGSLKAAAEEGKTPIWQMYKAMKDPAFKEIYKQLKTDVTRKASFAINDQIPDAISTITEIMNDPGINPEIRLQAAKTILEQSGKFADRLSWEEYQADLI